MGVESGPVTADLTTAVIQSYKSLIDDVKYDHSLTVEVFKFYRYWNILWRSILIRIPSVNLVSSLHVTSEQRELQSLEVS